MKYFRLTLIFLILAEIFSFCAFLYPIFNKICFVSILLLTLIVSLNNLGNGIYILFTELFIGSFGYLFFYDLGGTSISLRIGLFLVIMSVWLAKMINKEYRQRAITTLKSNKFLKYYLFLFVFLSLGVIIGLIGNNGTSNVFFDANAYAYFALVFPLLTTITDLKQVKNIFFILFAAATSISIKTLILLFIFSHKIYYLMGVLYPWVRDFRFAEITAMQGNFYRIFSQTHLYVLIPLFFMAVILWGNFKKISLLKRRDKIFSVLLFILFLSVIIVNLSRSFWVGGLCGFLVMGCVLIFTFKARLINIIKFFISLIVGTIGSILLIIMIVKFPYPREGTQFFIDLLGDRATAINEEVGASSRWNLLPPLVSAAAKHPLLGSGFGEMVTYKSNDPRVLAVNPTGNYSTFAFEWGYLDIILKIGLAGMFFYLLLILKIWAEGWRYMTVLNSNPHPHIISINDFSFPSLVISLLLGLILVLGTSIFSPYMNHPLGIGYIMLVTVVFSVFNDKMRSGK